MVFWKRKKKVHALMCFSNMKQFPPSQFSGSYMKRKKARISLPSKTKRFLSLGGGQQIFTEK